MQIEVSITADGSELPALVGALTTLKDADISVTTKEPETDHVVPDLTEEERYVLAAVQASSGSALRVIHRKANELDGSPFDAYSREDGWNDEREKLQNILWSLKSDNLVRNDGQQWYPTDDAPLDVIS